MNAFAQKLPIAVDLDGTLILTDLSRHSLIHFCVRYPWKTPMVPFWLSQGRAYIKKRLADHIDIEPQQLPYNPIVIRFIEEHKKRGHHLMLATGADQRYAHAVAEHLGLFDQVLASNGQENTISHQKARRLVDLFGERKFIYIGNSSQDLAVWEKAAYALAVNTPSSVLRKLEASGTPFRVL